MRVINFLKMNNWEITKFLRVIFAFQIVFLVVIWLDVININIFLLREILTSIYLLFIPGVIILRILKLHRLNNIETLLYSVGLSITSLMSIGFLLNTLLPIFNIFKPLSLFYLIIAMVLLVLFLSILSYIRDKEFSNEEYCNIDNIIPPKFGFIYLIPFLAIFGTYLMNMYQNNILLIIMILLIALIVILAAFDKISEDKYPLIIFVISISLLLHTSLISQYIWGWDINHEYYLANIVIENSVCDLSSPYNTNSMLSIVMLAPIISKVTNIDLMWVFKIIYPFIFSLVPVGLYMVFSRQSNGKIAFLATFFFMSVFSFYAEMNQLARQQIAELFYVLVIMLIIDDSMNKIQRSLLLILFAISIIVSHYGLSYIFMLCLIGVYCISLIHSEVVKVKTDKINLILENKISLSFVTLFIVFAIAWYIYLSTSTSFETIVKIGSHIIESIFTDFLNPQAAQGAAVLTAGVVTPLHNIAKYLNLLFQFFILFGLISTLYEINKTKFKVEYIFFALVNLFILVLSILLPFFASALNISRIYHISLFFLAPFAIIGGLKSFKILKRLLGGVNFINNSLNVDNSLKLLSIMFTIMFLFYSGFIYGVTNDNPTSISLSNIDYPITSTPETVGIEWLYDVKNNSVVFADSYRNFIVLKYTPTSGITSNIKKMNTSYIFVGKFNLETGTMYLSRRIKATLNSSYMPYEPFIENHNKLYDNGNAQFYF